MNGPYGDWIEKQIDDIRHGTDIHGAFWDSFQNLGFTCVDWSTEDRTPQTERILRLLEHMRRDGWHQRAEIVTPYCVSQVAMFGFEGDMFRRRLWSDLEKGDAAFALLDTSPSFFSESDPFTADRLSPARYFWLLGHRAVPSMDGRPWSPGAFLPGGTLAEEYGRLNRLYTAALPRMHRLRLVRGGACTLWLDASGAPAAIWCFRACKAPAKGDFADLESGEPAPARLEPGRVYVCR